MKLVATTIVTLLLAPTVAAAAPATPNEATRDALLQALDDERRSEATYAAVLDRHEGAMPFAHVVEAEGRHISHLLVLFEKYGVPVPANPWAERAIGVPATAAEACAQGVESETVNADLYDRLLEAVEEDDIRQTFTSLRNASRLRHLRAFERCADGGAMGGCGGGHWSGRGGGGGRHGEAPGGGCPCGGHGEAKADTGRGGRAGGCPRGGQGG